MSFLFRFNLIYDPLGKEKTDYSLEFLESSSRGMFVTIASPLLPNIDDHGILPGAVKWGLDTGISILKVCFHRQLFVAWFCVCPFQHIRCHSMP